MTSHTLAIANHAGGVGKTSTTLNLGFEIARTGRKVLLVDMDPQSDLSERVGTADKENNLRQALLHEAELHPKLLRWLDTDIQLVPSSIDMAATEVDLFSLMGRERRLRWALQPMLSYFDYILIDCPPSLSTLTACAFWAANGVIVPVQAEDKAYYAVGRTVQMVRETARERAKDNPDDRFTLFGMLLTMVKHTRMSNEVSTAVRETYRDLVFNTAIPERTAVAQDRRYHGPLAYYAPKDEATAQYEALAQEVINRAEA